MWKLDNTHILTLKYQLTPSIFRARDVDMVGELISAVLLIRRKSRSC